MTANPPGPGRRARLRFLLEQREAEPTRQRLGELLDRVCPGRWEMIVPPESEPLRHTVLDRLRVERAWMPERPEVDQTSFRARVDAWSAGLGEQPVLVLPSHPERVGILRMRAPDLREVVSALLEIDGDTLIVAVADAAVGAVAQRIERPADSASYLLETWGPDGREPNAEQDPPVEVEVLLARFGQLVENWSASAHTPLARPDTAVLRLVTGMLRRAGAWAELVERESVADRDGDPDAAVRVAWERYESGDENGFDRAMRRAAERGHERACWWVGQRHRDQGREQEARRWTERSQRARQRREATEADDARHGDAVALFRVAERLRRDADRRRTRPEHHPAPTPGELRETEERALELLRQAAEHGNADAAARLGWLLRGVSEQDALRWYRRADELGHPQGARALGTILFGRGDRAAGEAALRRAESRGDPEAASELAGWMRRLRDPVRAEAAYRRAARIGYLDHAWADLVGFLQERGDLAGAEAARRDGVAAGELRADQEP